MSPASNSERKSVATMFLRARFQKRLSGRSKCMSTNRSACRRDTRFSISSVEFIKNHPRCGVARIALPEFGDDGIKVSDHLFSSNAVVHQLQHRLADGAG